MCKYCERPELIENLSNCSTKMHIEKDLFVENGDFFLEILSKVDIGMGGCINILTSAKIDYCPFCGRKLENE